MSFRAMFGLASALALLVLPGSAPAQPCTTSCAHGRAVCSMQTRTARTACMQSCTFGDVQCHAACMQQARTARAACRAARTDCATTCPAADTTAPSCVDGCSTAAKACFGDVLATGVACVQGCKDSPDADLKSCLEQCAATIGSKGPICLATFQGCLIGCQGDATGTCFSTVAMACTTEACGPGNPCSEPNAFCSARCSAPPPSGTCLDLHTRQCTDATCSATQPCPADNQLCVPACPPPIPQGHCVDPATNECTDEPCDSTHHCVDEKHVCTLQCPHRTPVPQCSDGPCAGPCLIGPTCLPGQPCPEYPTRRGECMLDSGGNCGCVPASPPPTPTPQPTPTEQCDAAACGGDCVITAWIPCPLGKDCNNPRRLAKGECTTSADGGCECVPVLPTPPATPPPQCGGDACSGQCIIQPPCPLGAACPAFVIEGHCDVSADGSCGCIPDEKVTPTPGCATDDDCRDADPCTADRCVNGECEHACLCLSATGEPSCCPGPSALCVKPCGADADGTCGGSCPFGASCEGGASPDGGCGCASGPGGPCGGNILAKPAVCAAGLVCHQTLPDVVGYCEKPDCVPLFSSGCSDTSDCCEPCENGTHAPCGVCSNGTCQGAP